LRADETDLIIRGGNTVTDVANDKLLKLALTAFGAIFCLVYPMGLIWPSGWVWHGGQGQYYLQMICGIYAVLGVFLIMAAQNPADHRSLISFTIWSSIVHAAIMAAQAVYDGHELGHLIGDVPALLLVALVLWYLMPAKTQQR
jgi:FtsH-binding integral membrane protein